MDSLTQETKKIDKENSSSNNSRSDNQNNSD